MSIQDKPVEIPDKPKDWKPSEPPEFVRFYMGKENKKTHDKYVATPPSASGCG